MEGTAGHKEFLKEDFKVRGALAHLRGFLRWRAQWLLKREQRAGALRVLSPHVEFICFSSDFQPVCQTKT